MASAKTKRLISSGLVGAVWIGALAFTAWMLMPRLREALSLHQDLTDAEALLERRVEAELMPSEGVAARYLEIKKEMEKEAEACAYEYLRHNECLNKKVLESWRMKPYELAINFQVMKEQLENKAGNPNFLELGTLDDWEKQEHGKPRQEDFAAIEKRTCIAAVLVDLLTTEPKTIIQLMKIPDPVPAADAPPAVDWMVVRHEVYPVDVEFTTRFGSLGKLLNQILTTPPSSTNTPCMGISSIRVETAGGRDADTVKVHLTVNVYDFHKVETAG